MHLHAIVILATLSAGALSVSVTAKNFYNSDNLPNEKCTGPDTGENVNITPDLDPNGNIVPGCWLYEPPNGSYIWVDYLFDVGDSDYGVFAIDVFEDTDCNNFLTTIQPSTGIAAYNRPNYPEGGSDRCSDCVFMGEGVHWGSVKVQDSNYTGKGVSRVDG